MATPKEVNKMDRAPESKASASGRLDYVQTILNRTKINQIIYELNSVIAENRELKHRINALEERLK